MGSTHWLSQNLSGVPPRVNSVAWWAATFEGGSGVAESSTHPRTLLGLADRPGEPMVVEPWIGSFVGLGSRLRRYLSKLATRQLVLAVSVPRRDYVAALIGAGWMLSSAAPALDDPLTVFKSSDRSTCLRAVTDRLIVTGLFSKMESHPGGLRVLTGGKLLSVDRFRAVSVLEAAVESTVGEVPAGGYLAELAGAATSWLGRLASPPMDLALVGTSKWIREDLEAVIGNGTSMGEPGTSLGSYVLPYDDHAATWSTPVITAARLGEGKALPESCVAVVLDRYGAIKYLNDITVPIVVCIVDRSVADASAAEMLVEARNNNSRPVSVVNELGWCPPTAVEALAFTVAL